MKKQSKYKDKNRSGGGVKFDMKEYERNMTGQFELN